MLCICGQTSHQCSGVGVPRGRHIIQTQGGENRVLALPDPLRELWSRSFEQLTEVESQAVAELLHRHKDVLFPEQGVGKTYLVRHNIDTSNARPIIQQPRRTSPAKLAEIEWQVEDPTRSCKEVKSFAVRSVVLVNKNDDSRRFCVDY